MTAAMQRRVAELLAAAGPITDHQREQAVRLLARSPARPANRRAA